ncbi:MAG: hypothetical protein FWC26_05030 [Fibromonadales bacterium]|nr:hypothetical protein [Fibromonadales bacterium]
MVNRFILFVIAVFVGSAFIFSCSSDSSDNGNNSNGGNDISSSSVEYDGGSSSSIVIVAGTGCDIQGYKTVKIGEQTWMAENFNCEVTGSVCFLNDTAWCAKYGRLYDWVAAATVCPSGWHLPSKADWEELISYAGGSSVAGIHLKAKIDWHDEFGDVCGPSGSGSPYLCEDTFGFSALPGEMGHGGDYFITGGVKIGVWWSSSEYSGDRAYYFGMALSEDDIVSGEHHPKHSEMAVRCLKD